MARSQKSGSKSPPAKASSSSTATGAGRKTRGSPRQIVKAKSAVPVLSAAYLDRHSSKNDLVRRLKAVVEALSDEDVEPDSPDHPGLAGLAAALVEDRYLEHKDKEVRLHTVLACMEIFYLYAPEPPWDVSEILAVFSQTIRQLANLSHCTSPTQTNFNNYFRLLEQLAVVKIGVVLVELTRTLESETTPGGGSAGGSGEGKAVDGGSSEEALELLSELIRTILQSVSVDHPPEVSRHAASAVAACVEEFDGTVPIPVLDEILSPIGAGPFVYVTNPKHVEAAAAMAAAAKKKGKKGGAALAAEKKKDMPPAQIKQTNQSYVVASNVVRKTEDRISTPVASLLNGLLNGDPNVESRTNLLSSDAVAGGAPESATSLGGGGALPPSTPTGNVFTIVYELHRISPQILTTVIGTVTSSLLSPNLDRRLRATKLLGRLFYAPSSNIGTQFRPCYRQWIRRAGDIEPKVRSLMVRCLCLILEHKGGETPMRTEASGALIRIIENDPSFDVRLLAIHLVCDLAHDQRLSEEGTAADRGTGPNGIAPPERTGTIPVVSARLLRAVGHRVSSKNKTERRDAITGLAQIYHRHYVRPKLRDVQSGGDDCDIEIVLDALRDATASPSAEEEERGGGKGGGKRKKAKRKPSTDDNGDGDHSELYDARDKFGWVPRTVFECVCFTDETDPEMRNRIVQIVDDVLLGSGNAPASKGAGDGKGPSSKGAKDENDGAGGGGKKGPLTPTSRAVGLAAIVDSLQDRDGEGQQQQHHHHGHSDAAASASASAAHSDAYKFMCKLLAERANLQRALARYIDARAKTKDASRDRAAIADAEAVERLEDVSRLTAPAAAPSSSGSSSAVAADATAVLKKLHAAKDRHIFRILATIASPTHSAKARNRAFDELPKRTANLGSAASTWVKTLARRTAMGHFVNVEVVTHCILLAQEAFHEEDLEGAMKLLACVRMAVSIYPTLGGTKEGFGTLVELFGECRDAHHPGKLKKSIDDCGIVTALSGILAVAAPARAASFADGNKLSQSQSSGGTPGKKDRAPPPLDPELQAQLLRLCTRDGTPQQARHAVYTLSSLANPPPPPKDRAGGSAIADAEAVRRERDAFEPLLRALTSPSRMSLHSKNVVSVLTALSASAECAPTTFGIPGGRGEKAIRFALENVVLGRGQTEDEESDSDKEGSDGESDGSGGVSVSQRRLSQDRRKSAGGAKGKGGKGKGAKKGARGADAAQEHRLSLPCRRLCAAIELLVTHVRSTILKAQHLATQRPKEEPREESAKEAKVSRKSPRKKSTHDEDVPAIRPPSREHIAQIFAILIQILQDSGLPPSGPDRQEECRYTTSERAALRQYSAVHLLRLCDASLKLEQAYLTPGMFQILSGAFLDEEVTVRESVLDELSMMLTGQGKYFHDTTGFAPSLRFLSLIVLCADAEHGHGHSSSNGNAAYVGRRSLSTKNAALQCISLLRRTCEDTLAQCRAIGRHAEDNFDNRLKMLLMPEFAVPFALHLLSFRRETPSAGGTKAGVGATVTSQTGTQSDADENDADAVAHEEARHRMLKKRLKWLLEPLVQSLGEGADNISFLFKMTELLGGKYQPVDVSRPEAAASSAADVSLGSPNTSLGISLDGPYESAADKKNDQISAAKLKVICVAAREVLLTFVKKDVNLTPYPAAIQLPQNLFRRASSIDVEADENKDAGRSTSPLPLRPGKSPTASKQGNKRKNGKAQASSGAPAKPKRRGSGEKEIKGTASKAVAKGQKERSARRKVEPDNEANKDGSVAESPNDQLEEDNRGARSNRRPKPKKRDDSIGTSQVHFSPELELHGDVDDDDDGGIGDFMGDDDDNDSAHKKTGKGQTINRDAPSSTPSRRTRRSPRLSRDSSKSTDDDDRGWGDISPIARSADDSSPLSTPASSRKRRSTQKGDDDRQKTTPSSMDESAKGSATPGVDEPLTPKNKGFMKRPLRKSAMATPTASTPGTTTSVSTPGMGSISTPGMSGSVSTPGTEVTRASSSTPSGSRKRAKANIEGGSGGKKSRKIASSPIPIQIKTGRPSFGSGASKGRAPPQSKISSSEKGKKRKGTKGKKKTKDDKFNADEFEFHDEEDSFDDIVDGLDKEPAARITKVTARGATAKLAASKNKKAGTAPKNASASKTTSSTPSPTSTARKSRVSIGASSKSSSSSTPRKKRTKVSSTHNTSDDARASTRHSRRRK